MTEREKMMAGEMYQPMDPELVPQEVIDEVKAREQEILEGDFEVSTDDTEPTSTR